MGGDSMKIESSRRYPIRESLFEAQVKDLIERLLEGIEEQDEGKVAEDDWYMVHVDLAPLILDELRSFAWPTVHKENQ